MELDLVCEALEAARDESHRAVGVLARPAAAYELDPSAQVTPTVSMAARQLGECAGDRVEPVDAWTTLARALVREKTSDPCRFNHPARAPRECHDRARAEGRAVPGKLRVEERHVKRGRV